MSLLELRQIGKKEGEKSILADISFIQQQGQHIAIAGATGSGKTTLLRTIAGLVQPTSGEVLFKEKKIKGPDEKLIPGHPDIAFLSQYFELRHHYRVEELLDMNNHLVADEAKTIIQLCRIDHLLSRWTHQLSGGEKQRIALACLLVSSPKMLLLDEPYSNLDYIHKNILKTVINDISAHLEMTCMLVAHDPLDVLPWADRVIVLRQGKMIQDDSPQDIYGHPANEYVTALFGKYNRLTPLLVDGLKHFSQGELPAVNSMVRPEQFKITAAGKGMEGRLSAGRFMGGYYELEVDVANTMITLYSRLPFRKNDAVYFSL